MECRQLIAARDTKRCRLQLMLPQNLGLKVLRGLKEVNFRAQVIPESLVIAVATCISDVFGHHRIHRQVVQDAKDLVMIVS